MGSLIRSAALGGGAATRRNGSAAAASPIAFMKRILCVALLVSCAVGLETVAAAELVMARGSCAWGVAVALSNFLGCYGRNQGDCDQLQPERAHGRRSAAACALPLKDQLKCWINVASSGMVHACIWCTAAGLASSNRTGVIPVDLVSALHVVQVGSLCWTLLSFVFHLADTLRLSVHYLESFIIIEHR